MQSIKDLNLVHSGVFRGPSGKSEIIYSEPDNIYETVEVYVLVQDGILVGSYISEHSYDGASTWRLVNLNPESFEMLQTVMAKERLGNDVIHFLQQKFFNRENIDIMDFAAFLKQYGIPFEEKFYM